MASILVEGQPTHVHGALRVAWRAGGTLSTPAVATTATFLLWPLITCDSGTRTGGRRESHLVHTALISLATITTRFNVRELLCSCSDKRDPKLMWLWIPLFLPPGFPSTRCPVYVNRSVRGDQTIICSTLCSITSEVMMCMGGKTTDTNGNSAHFRSVIAILDLKLPFVVFFFYTRHFSCCLGGWGGGSCYTEKPVNQTQPSGGWQGH